ncbi:MAG: IclR family transcriptional regulator [Desulfarculaceae bacterium]|nr:IclR family transcriptional regulator [Desulfarculaceae bacterium]MCF8047438.1 IclR family transcriptional regulator [Desulfarculaceae bacterium]MCF8098775.1 IclR family transcriptional regulator [Desulfarculaceae bacterium]MCF8122096.1 IclR family transcriptional regulator [Desulfarculaceae bacterium]
MSNNQLIKSVGKGFALLELLVRSADPLTLTQIAKELGHTKTTTQRLINTLLALGYLKRIEGKRYVPGNKVLALSFQLLQKDNLYKQAQSLLEKISDQLAYSITLSVMEDNEILVVYRKEKARYLPYAIYTGSKLPPHCSATGKVLLSSLPDDKLEDVLSRIVLTKVTPKTITDRTEITQEFNKIRQRGYSVSNQELSLDLYAIGIPLVDGRGKVVAAAGLSVPIKDKGDKAKLSSSMSAFFEVGRQISLGLGYDGPYPQINL